MNIKAAVIGCGHLGAYHAEKYSVIPNVDLIAVCDKDQEKAIRLAKKYKCRSVIQIDELFDLGVQCVSIASDTKTHFDIGKKLLENDIDILVEKPVTVELKQAEELIQIANTKGRILQVGHVERFNPAIIKMKEHLKNPWFFEVRRISEFKARGADVDVILDLMIHDIDLLLYLVERPIINIQAVGVPVLTDSIDIANARIEFEGGVIANLSTSRAAFQSERTFRVFQENSYISLNLESKKIKIVTKEKGKNILGITNISKVEQDIDTSDALKEEIESFVNSVRLRTPPLVSGHDGLLALKLVEDVKSAIQVSFNKFNKVQ